MTINDETWWNEYFEKNWKNAGGRMQTQYFMNLIINNIIDINGFNILDWGCAFGDGVDCLSKSFISSKIVGMDRSPVAIDECKKNYPNYVFEVGEEIKKRFDVVITSHCLEHFENPFPIIEKQLNFVDKYYIIFVPYKEDPRIFCHFFTFDENSFKDYEGFETEYKILPRCPVWQSEMILYIYRKKNIRRLLK